MSHYNQLGFQDYVSWILALIGIVIRRVFWIALMTAAAIIFLIVW